jgi:hypothetical protein
MNQFYKRLDNTSILEYVISALVTVTIIGIIFPYKFPVFSALLLVLIGLSFSQRISIRIYPSIVPFFVLQLFYFTPLLFNNELYNNAILDISNIIITNCFLIIFSSILIDPSKFKRVLRLSGRLIFYSCVIVSFISVFKFSQLLNGEVIDWFLQNDEYPWGSSLVSDYNYYSLGLIIGFLFGLRELSKHKNILAQYSLINFQTLIVINILLSGSRRGQLLIILLLFILAIRSFIEILKKRSMSFSQFSILILITLSYYVLLKNTTVDLNRIDTYEVDKLLYRVESIFQTKESSGLSERVQRWN